MAFRLFTSNRMEELASGLAALVAKPLADEFASELVVVQSRGMDRYLSLRLSAAHGVWANCRYPFPSAYVGELARALLPQADLSGLYEREVLTWRIYALLEQSPAPELKHYLERGGLRAYQLARSLADVFDQYQIFRPEVLRAWEAGQLLYAGAHGEHWQAGLWRELAGAGGLHRAALFARLLEKLPGSEPARLPERLSLFGISYLPPVYLAIFAALAEIIEVNVFSLSPSRHFWADIVSLKEQARLEPAAHLNVGNSLLASLGRQSRAFFESLSEYDAGIGAEVYHEADASLLGRIQNQILNLEQPNPSETADRHDEADASLAVHSCHSVLRELEVLHDNLLGLLEDDPEMSCEDIVVMAPDIEAYAPYVAAVFEREPRLNFNIADRSLLRSSAQAEAFLRLLALPESRLTASQVLDLLETEPVAARLGFATAELELVRRWVTETGIRWGRDAEQRAELGLPPEAQNTWQAGLERLLMGYATGGAEFCAGILPFEVELGQATVLGRFCRFCGQLFEFSRAAVQPRPLKAWQLYLAGLLDEFFEPDDETQHLREQLQELARLAELSAQTSPIELAVVRAWLAERLKADVSSGGFLSGGVTFCSLLPMRSIPFKVVCLLGLGHDGFPRRQRASGFDLIARHPRRGDRSRRDDDLYLFLETLLAARRHLYLSYVGQSIKDGSKLPPSVLVSELLDYCGLSEDFVTLERLQAFSPAYFDGSSRLFSFSEANLAGARALTRPPAPDPAEWPLADPEPSFRNVGLNELVRFFRNPSAYLLEKRLGCQLVRLAELPDDREPFGLDSLAAYGLKRELLKAAGPQAEARLRAQGLLPHGPRGAEVCRTVAAQVAELARQVEAYGPASRLVPLELDLAGFQLTGALELCAGDVLLISRPGKLRPCDRFEAWLKLLALAAAGQPAKAVLLGLADGKPAGLELRAPQAAAGVLAELLELYWRGLSWPLPFFAQASAAYAAAWLKDPDKAAAAARKAFADEHAGPAEREDAAIRRCFAGRAALDAEFEALALRLWQPLLEQEVALA